LTSSEKKKEKGDTEVNQGVCPNKKNVSRDILGIADTIISLEGYSSIDAPHLWDEVVHESHNDQHFYPGKKGDPASTVLFDQENKSLCV
jgi:hypothetical protein